MSLDRLDALRLFVRLRERGSFSAAARDLRIKQSTASKWVAELEEELGVGLVERTTRAIRITEAGQRFARRAVEILDAVDETTRELSDLGEREPSGRVRVSAPVVYGRLFVAPLMAKFLKHHPRVEAELVLSDRYVNLVEEGFDLAIRVGVPADTSARGRKLADSARRLVASPAYVEKHGAPKTPKELERHPCLTHSEAFAGAIWRFRLGPGREVPVAVRGPLSSNNSDVALEMARRGLGIALLADWLVAADLRANKLVELLPDHQAPPAPVFAVTPASRFVAAPVRALLDALTASDEIRSSRSR
ncbi:MAG: LysR family transcriptional regulator [Polyangiaceae bacterium]|nr:LysR family transcriptional regulator [Polyangiaceae bacterium]